MDTHARLLIASFLAIGLLLGAAGCQSASTAITSFGEWIGGATNSLANTSSRDFPVELDLDGPVGLDVESFNGDVTIECDPELTLGTITVTREATHGFQRRGEARASLDEIDYAVDLIPGEVGQILKIRTWTTNGEPHFQRAHLHITMPEVDGVFIRTSNGKVTASDIEGEVDIVTSQGNVLVMTNKPMYEAVTILNNSGSINYRVRGESTGEIDCMAVRGKVHHHVRHGELIVHNGTSFNVLKATLNSGTNPIVLRAANGDVRVAVVAAPTAVGVVIVP